jgi:hypothetical protein
VEEIVDPVRAEFVANQRGLSGAPRPKEKNAVTLELSGKLESSIRVHAGKVSISRENPHR